MKKLRKCKMLFLLLFAVVSVTKAQNVEPIVSEGKRWNVVFREFLDPMQPYKFTTICYKLEGDTILDGVSYKLMHSTLYEDLTHWNLNSVFREDAGKVFCRDYYTTSQSFDNEKLIYDFSMQPDDSICMFNNVFLILDKIVDTVMVEKTMKKYCFHYSENGIHDYGSKEIWIEGIGSEYGIFNTGDLYLDGGKHFLLCSYEKENLVWQNADFNTCFYTNWDVTGINEAEANDEVSVYPNPVSHLLKIEGVEVAEVFVYNCFGRLVRVSKSNEMNVDDFVQGMYFMRIISVDGKVFNKSVMVK